MLLWFESTLFLRKLHGTTQPDWFFDREHNSGVLCDVGSHQFYQFLYFTGSTKAPVVAWQVGNPHDRKHPGMEDFGDAMLRGDGDSGYIRVDWFTPDALPTWGERIISGRVRLGIDDRLETDLLGCRLMKG